MDNAKRSREEILEKIRRLLEIRVDRGATPAEAEAAEHHARRLLEEYQLSIFDVQAQTFNETVVEEQFSAGGKRVENWQGRLALHLCAAYDCRSLQSVRLTSDGREIPILILVGHETDVIIVRYLFHSLSARLFDLATAEGLQRGKSGRELSKYRNTYIVNAAYEIRERLERERIAEQGAAGSGDKSTALVRHKRATVDRWFEQHYLHTREVRSRATPDLSGASDGRRTGRNLEIRRGIEASPNKQIGEQK